MLKGLPKITKGVALFIFAPLIIINIVFYFWSKTEMGGTRDFHFQWKDGKKISYEFNVKLENFPTLNNKKIKIPHQLELEGTLSLTKVNKKNEEFLSAIIDLSQLKRRNLPEEKLATDFGLKTKLTDFLKKPVFLSIKNPNQLKLADLPETSKMSFYEGLKLHLISLLQLEIKNQEEKLYPPYFGKVKTTIEGPEMGRFFALNKSLTSSKKGEGIKYLLDTPLGILYSIEGFQGISWKDSEGKTQTFKQEIKLSYIKTETVKISSF